MNTIRLRTGVAGIGVLAGSLALAVGPASTAGVCEMAKLVDPGGAVSANLGYSVSLSGNAALVGVPGDDTQANNSGTAFVYRWSGSSWMEEAQLFGTGVLANAAFGIFVALDGDVAVVGAFGDDDYGLFTGSAFVYRWNGSSWVEEAKLLASDGAQEDYFGIGVAVSGDVIVVGAKGDDDNGTDAGAAYVYRWDGLFWGEEAKLVASDGANLDSFGESVAVSGDRIMVGAAGDDDQGSTSGSAYAYHFNGSAWVEQPKLLASDGDFSDEFGESVALDGDVAVIGTPDDEPGGSGSGSAYVFRFNGASWAEEAKLVASDGAADDVFGTSVSVSGDVVVVGAHGDDDNGTDSGSAYVYHWNGFSWAEQPKLLASDGADSDEFGWAVSVNGDVGVVGARFDDDYASGTGSAYVFGGVSAIDCNGNGLADACEIMAGITDDLDHSLVPDTCSTDVFAYNLTADTLHDTIADAIDQAVSGDDLIATEAAFGLEPDIDFDGKAISLASLAGIDQAAGGLIVLADGARLETATDGSTFMALNGQLRVQTGDAADLETDYLDAYTTSEVMCHASSRLDVSAAASWLWGVTRVHEQATLVFGGGPVRADGGLTVSPGGTFGANAGLLTTGPVILDGGGLDVQESLEVDATGTIMANAGDLFVTGWGDNVGTITLTASEFYVTGSYDNSGTMTLITSDFFVTGECDNVGTLNLLNGLMTSESVSNAGLLGLSGSTVYAGGIVNDAGGRFNTSGEIQSDVTNDGDVYCIGDTMVVGIYTNNGTTTVQVGTLTIVGTLINNGIIIGDVVGGFRDGGSTQPGDGLAIAGDYVAGVDATLLLGDPLWVLEVGGNYDVAIDDHTRYHMVEAELRMAGAGQSFELMSLDIGADPAGLDRTIAGHFPVGTLVIESGSTVDLADVHDNDGLGQGLCEALYVRHLDLAPGATLNTLGCVVYYETAMIDGAIDDPANVIALPPPCPWDCDVSGDGQVSVTDFLAMLAQWGQVGAPCDFDNDGVGVVDFLALLGHWGPCPP